MFKKRSKKRKNIETQVVYVKNDQVFCKVNKNGEPQWQAVTFNWAN